MLLKTLKLIATASILSVLAGCPQEDVEALAADNMNGRAPKTGASSNAQNWLIAKLQEMGAKPLQGNFKQVYGSGTNILGLIPGTDLSNEYIIIGAHYDHLGNNCSSNNENDNICNGAADNAAGVATVLEIAEAITREGRLRRRNLIVAFWDGEEDGLIGSQVYTNNPLVPLNKTVAYVNFDIMASNLLPSLRYSTFVIGGETGGSNLKKHVFNSVVNPNNPINAKLLTTPFGQHRSDHASFLSKRVPSVFFTDAPNACYHTAQDEASKLDYEKLQYQINLSKDLTLTLLNTNEKPTFTSASQLSYNDAVHLNNLANAYTADLDLFNSTQRTKMVNYKNRIFSVASNGPNAYNGASFDILADASLGILTEVAQLPCQSFITE